jgi:2-keto-4-pentenoate hydratase/2-oxohepta-3-ene-1,7-dioic acid hydratase in catechol pathway
MKIIRYQDASGAIHFGRQHDDGSATQIRGDIFAELTDTGTAADVAKLLAPIVPVDILCIGLNYAKHAAEGKQPLPEFPVLFMKNIGALQNPGDPIVIPRALKCETVDYECELGVVIGKECLNVSAADALDYVLGYTCAHDVSERHWQKHGGGGQWCRGKTFQTFCPLGPCLVTTDEITDPQTLNIKTTLNGQVMQDGNTDDMIFSVRRLIEFLSAGMRLLPGTIILTGTPQGVGAARTPPVYLRPGDTVTISIEGIGDLTNPVIAE